MQNYNNPGTNVFDWRKRIRQMRWSEVPIRTGSVQIKPWLLISVHTVFAALVAIYYLFYIAVGEKIIIKTCPCLLLF